MIDANGYLTELGQRLGPFAPLVNLASVGAWALRECGYTPANPLNVTSADLAIVPDADLSELFDFAHYAAAERVIENLDPIQLAQHSIRVDKNELQDLRRFWRDRVDDLYRKLQKKYGYGLAELGIGNLNLGSLAGDDGGEE